MHTDGPPKDSMTRKTRTTEPPSPASLPTSQPTSPASVLRTSNCQRMNIQDGSAAIAPALQSAAPPAHGVLNPSSTSLRRASAKLNGRAAAVAGPPCFYSTFCLCAGWCGGDSPQASSITINVTIMILTITTFIIIIIIVIITIISRIRWPTRDCCRAAAARGQFP